MFLRGNPLLPPRAGINANMFKITLYSSENRQTLSLVHIDLANLFSDVATQ
jgi:hypothetical protein